MIYSKQEAIILDRQTLLYHISKQEKCKVQLIEKSSFISQGYGIAMSKGSKLQRKLSNLTRTYRDRGFFDELTEKWFRTPCKINQEDNLSSLAPEKVGGAFIILLGMIAFSCMIFLYECLVHSAESRRRRYQVENCRERSRKISRLVYE